MNHMKKYDGLYQLMEENMEAQQFYASLPDYVQETIHSRADNVRSLEELQRYADNLLQGDD